MAPCVSAWVHNSLVLCCIWCEISHSACVLCNAFGIRYTYSTLIARNHIHKRVYSVWSQPASQQLTTHRMVFVYSFRSERSHAHTGTPNSVVAATEPYKQYMIHSKLVSLPDWARALLCALYAVMYRLCVSCCEWCERVACTNIYINIHTNERTNTHTRHFTHFSVSMFVIVPWTAHTLTPSSFGSCVEQFARANRTRTTIRPIYSAHVLSHFSASSISFDAFGRTAAASMTRRKYRDFVYSNIQLSVFSATQAIERILFYFIFIIVVFFSHTKNRTEPKPKKKNTKN